MKKLQLTLFLGFIVSFVAYGQSEKDRNFHDVPKSAEANIQFENNESPNSDSKVENGQKTNLTPVKDPKSSSSSSLKKDHLLNKQGGDKDSKKEEISTLSFNLFLYIVDRFKED